MAYRLEPSFTLAEDALWAACGYQLAWAQLELPVTVVAEPIIKVSAMPKLTVETGKRVLAVAGEEFPLAFDTYYGTLAAWEFEGIPLVRPGRSLTSGVRRPTTMYTSPRMGQGGL